MTLRLPMKFRCLVVGSKVQLYINTRVCLHCRKSEKFSGVIHPSDAVWDTIEEFDSAVWHSPGNVTTRRLLAPPNHWTTRGKKRRCFTVWNS